MLFRSDRFTAKSSESAPSLIHLRDVRNAEISRAHLISPTNVFVDVVGSKTKNIKLTNNDFSLAKKVFRVENKSLKKHVQITDKR